MGVEKKGIIVLVRKEGTREAGIQNRLESYNYSLMFVRKAQCLNEGKTILAAALDFPVKETALRYIVSSCLTTAIFLGQNWDDVL